MSKHERRKINMRLAEIEDAVQSLETQLEVISADLEHPPEDSQEVLRLGDEYVTLQDHIETLMSEWSELQEKLEQ